LSIININDAKIVVHQGDLPDDVRFAGSIAVDTETQGLNLHRDRLCMIQMSAGDGTAHLVQFPNANFEAPNVKALMADKNVTKIFQYARFDVAVLKQYLGVDCTPVYCTKIASKLVRTYTEGHGLKALCKELLGVELSKEQQSSDWALENLSDAQLRYAASDVLYLHKLREKLDEMLVREDRTELAAACFEFIPVRAALDIGGWQDVDIFHH